MAYLNWKEASLKLEMRVHSDLKTKLSLVLSKEGVQSLVSHLDEVFTTQSGELRLSLPENWILFWKIREEGARSLLAHPAPEEWVGTIALERPMGQSLIVALSQLDIGQSLVLSELLLLHSVSNLELTLFVEDSSKSK